MLKDCGSFTVVPFLKYLFGILLWERQLAALFFFISHVLFAVCFSSLVYRKRIIKIRKISSHSYLPPSLSFPRHQHTSIAAPTSDLNLSEQSRAPATVWVTTWPTPPRHASTSDPPHTCKHSRSCPPLFITVYEYVPLFALHQQQPQQQYIAVQWKSSCVQTPLMLLPLPLLTTQE